MEGLIDDEQTMEEDLVPCGHESDTPVCMKCILSKATLQDSHLELLSDICESLSVSKKNRIRKDLLDLEENIGPLYDSNLGEVEALLSKVVKQHKDRKNVILDLGDELHKVVDLVINKYLSEAGKIEKEDLDFLQSMKSTFKMSASEIKAAIKEYREFLATDNNKKLAKYQSKNEQFRKMPTRYGLKVTKFQPKHLTEEKLCQIIGVIPWSEKTEIKPQVNGDSHSESALKESGSSPNAKKENGGKQSKADKLTELNDLMESISQATKDLVVALSPKVTRKLAVQKEFSNSKVTSPKDKVIKGTNAASEVQCQIESKPKSTPIMNGHIESNSKTTQEVPSTPVDRSTKAKSNSEAKSTLQPNKEPNCILDPKCTSSPIKEPMKSEISMAKNMEIDIPIQSTKAPTRDMAAISNLQPSKEPNCVLDPKCRSSPLKEPNSPKETSMVTTKLNVPLTFSSTATAELSKEKKAVEHSSKPDEEVKDSTKTNVDASSKTTDLTTSSPQKTKDPKVELKECLENTRIDEDALVETFSKTSTMLIPESEETNVFANAPWVVDTYDTGYTYTYKIACASSTNQIFICGNNKVIKQMNSEGKFVEKASTESGNQPFDLALSSDAQLMYSDHNGKCVNVVRNNGKIENLIKLQKWFPMALCTTAANDLLVTMESEDLAMSKVVRYAGSTVKQEIQYKVKGDMLYCRADFVKENKNLDVVVSDLGARRIVVVDKYGIFRFNYTGNLQSNRYKSFGCSGVTTNSKCHIIVADEYNDVLHVVDQNGQFLTYIDNCNLQRPGDLCTDTEDALYVTEPVANKIKKIKLYR